MSVKTEAYGHEEATRAGYIEKGAEILVDASKAFTRAVNQGVKGFLGRLFNGGFNHQNEQALNAALGWLGYHGYYGRDSENGQKVEQRAREMLGLSEPKGI